MPDSNPQASPAALGVQLYSVRDAIGPADLPATLGRLAGLGFTHVEPYRILGDTAGLAAAIRDAGLSAVAAHADVASAGQDAFLAAARQLGLRTLIVPMTDPARMRDKAGVLARAEEINAAARRAADDGIIVGYHNHDFEFRQRVDGVPVYEILADALDEEVVLQLDTQWASVGGGDVFELLPRLGSRIGFLHIALEPPVDDPSPAGTGIAGRLAEVVALGRQAGAMIVVEVEVVVDGDPFPELARNAAFFLDQVRA